MIRSAVVLAAFLTVSLNVFAQDKKGPLTDLPSKPGAHIEKIKAMGDNEWLQLGAPAADPKWGKARGSAWGAKALILAPDKRGAFLFGEGVHAYLKPDGHVMGDLWFYDINKHAWLCLYPGTNTKTFMQRVKDGQLLIDENGQLTEDGERPVPLPPWFTPGATSPTTPTARSSPLSVGGTIRFPGTFWAAKSRWTRG